MLQRSKGFLLAELIITLAGWLMIAGIMIPLVIRIITSSIDTKMEFEASQYLYEYLIRANQEGFNPSPFFVPERHKVFDLTIRGGLKDVLEICVVYEDPYKKRREICEIYE
ncbi:hypothetical protein [Cytobacillus purgationiresistens]|uniref:Type II secretion system protein n=1 Tax=Cytobacillus purgationiresistens TaxID=863449 RepID=A0ABU0ADV9_9BACI|nr:hypothetical protein [Cytobacillus purgationiresistens]MDQ0269424.1 hypothetical protein [Cytobacillus purgationiresistens]